MNSFLAENPIMLSVDDFIDNLNGEEKLISRHLRSLILDADPRITEKLSYGVPYFSRNRRLCFIWPASQPGLNKHSNRPPHVTLGFCYGNLLSGEQCHLIKDGRKQVFTVEFFSPAEIREKHIAEVIAEAIAADQYFFGKKIL